LDCASIESGLTFDGVIGGMLPKLIVFYAMIAIIAIGILQINEVLRSEEVDLARYRFAIFVYWVIVGCFVMSILVVNAWFLDQFSRDQQKWDTRFIFGIAPFFWMGFVTAMYSWRRKSRSK
jgi:hypothetical protein